MVTLLLIVLLLGGAVIASLVIHGPRAAAIARDTASELEDAALGVRCEPERYGDAELLACQHEWDAANLRAYARSLERWDVL